MKTWMKVASVALVAVIITLAFGNVGAANAQGQAGDQQQQRKGMMVLGALLDAAAQATGQTRADLLKELGAGKTLAEVVKAHNGDPAAVQATAKATITTNINKMVTDGTITQAQADKIIGNLDTILDKAMNHQFPNRQQDRRVQLLQGAGLSILFQQTAKAANISQRDLLKELRDGKTLAQVAAEHNADPAAIITTAVQDATNRINKLVQNGKLKQDQADKLIASLPDFFKGEMNKVNPLGSRRPNPNGAQPTQQPTAQPTAAATPSL